MEEPRDVVTAGHADWSRRPPRPGRSAGVSLWWYVVLLPVWFPLTAGLAVGVAGAGTDWAGVGLLVLLCYPVAVLAAAVLVRSAERQGDRAAARRWRLLPMPWALAMGGFLAWALNR